MINVSTIRIAAKPTFSRWSRPTSALHLTTGWQTLLFGHYNEVDTLDDIETKFAGLTIVNMRSHQFVTKWQLFRVDLML